MYRFTWIILLIAIIGLTACGGKKKTTIDTSKFEAGLQIGEGPLKVAAPQIVSAVSKGNYQAAFTTIKAAIVETRPTTEQMDAVYELIAQVQMIISEDANKSTPELNLTIRQVGNIMEGLPENAGADYSELEKMKATPQ